MPTTKTSPASATPRAIATACARGPIFWGPKIWDVAAGVAIVREAGGVALCRPGPLHPWLDLHSFDPAPAKRGQPPSLRGWKGSILAGSPPATRVIAADIRGRIKVPEPVKTTARRLVHRPAKH